MAVSLRECGALSCGLIWGCPAVLIFVASWPSDDELLVASGGFRHLK